MRIFDNKIMPVAIAALLTTVVPAANAQGRGGSSPINSPRQTIRVTPFVCDDEWQDFLPSDQSSGFVSVPVVNRQGLTTGHVQALQIDTTAEFGEGEFDEVAGAVIDGVAGLPFNSIQMDIAGACGDLGNFGFVIQCFGNDAFGNNSSGLADCDAPDSFVALQNGFTRLVWTPNAFAWFTPPGFSDVTQLTGFTVVEQGAPATTLISNVKVNNKSATNITGVTLGCVYAPGTNPFELFPPPFDPTGGGP